MPGVDEKVGGAPRRPQWCYIQCARLEYAHDRGADRDDAPAIASRLLDRPSGCRWKRVPLLVHRMILDTVAADRSEGGEADVETQRCPPDARATQTLDHRGGEMQPRCRGGRGIRVPVGVHRLVALGV